MVSKKAKIIIVGVGFVVLLGVGGVYTGNLTQERTEETDQIIKEKQAGQAAYERSLLKEAEDRKNGLLEPRRLSRSELGIKADTDGPSEIEKGAYAANSWTGYLNENDPYSVLGVTAGGDYSNPLQGRITITEVVGGVPRISSGEYKHSRYLTPTATGPVRIVSELNGVLTLESIAGTFEVYNLNPLSDTDWKLKKITASGGGIYYFDLRTRTFN